MANYECTIICSPELPAEKIDELVGKIKKLVESSNGQILITQQLGKKRLAYPINKNREGSYVYIELSGIGETISALENFFKVNDTIIRYLTVKAGKKRPPKPVAAPAVATTPAEGEPAAEAVQGEVKPDGATKPSVTGAE